jgi:hypothetical protein
LVSAGTASRFIDAMAVSALFEAAKASLPEQLEYWGGLAAGIAIGAQLDELSAAALRAWKARWWREPLGRGRRLMHLVRAAAAMAYPDGIEFAAMPLGAVRATAPKSGAFWEPAEPKTELARDPPALPADRRQSGLCRD